MNVFYENIDHVDGCGFTIRYDCIEANLEIGYHTHPEIELQYVLRGSGTHVLGDITEPVHEGELILVPKYMPHAWYWDDCSIDDSGCVEEYALQFNIDMIRGAIGSVAEMKSVLDYFENLTYPIEILGETAQNIKCLLIELKKVRGSLRFIKFLTILELLNNNVEYRVVESNEHVDIRQNIRMDNIYQYLVDNHTRKITIDEMANFTGMNKSSFCIYFKKVTGKTFTSILNEYRINRAAIMLYNNLEFSINDICYMVGFSDPSYFNRTFKKYKGRSPMSYRKNR